MTATQGEGAKDVSEPLQEPIAVIGMAGRFPGAPDVDALWDLVSEGRDSFVRFDESELEDCFDDSVRKAGNYVPARPFLADADKFDAEFFGMYPREAAMIDPQFRVFLETCWEALENAGCDPAAFDGPIGVYAGSSMSTYLLNNLLSTRRKVEEFASGYQVGSFNELIGSIVDTLATRVAYKLDLKGPAVTVQSACSTSLLAITEACQSLLTYQSDMALAGGVSITFPQKRGYLYQEGGMVSPDGRCRPFDADAAGTVFGHGAAAVVLKRLSDAQRDGDHIYSVIRGYSVNNDGSAKAGFTAPSAQGQADAIMLAHANAAVSPGSVGYVECHGTATPLGDPIEFNGLTMAFGEQAAGCCALGSVKGNIGHLDAAAGVSGFIKAVLALHHGVIPGQANYAAPNPHINLAASPFYVPTETKAWESAGPRRAGVSSFGVGGTNVHVVLEEAPATATQRAEPAGALVLPFSARSEAALREMPQRLAVWLRRHPGAALADVAGTLQQRRRAFPHRAFLTAASIDEVQAQVEAGKVIAGEAGGDPPPVIFMFPGQGSQYAGMAGDLYAAEPEFARWIDLGADLAKGMLGLDLRDLICRQERRASNVYSQALRETRLTQPALYIIEFALARLWMSRGVTPAAMIGHSVGEFVAATLANVMTYEDGLRLVTERARLMQAQPAGSMLSVRAPAEAAMQFLGPDIDLAAVNAPRLSVLAGPTPAIERLMTRLKAEDIAFSKVQTSHAFHSEMMDQAAEALRAEAEKVAYGTPTIPFVSCVTGDWQNDEAARSPGYWARHCRATVRFADALRTVCAGRKPALIEVGPGRTLSTFAGQTVARENLACIVQSLPDHDSTATASQTIAEAHGRLWMLGAGLKWPLRAEHYAAVPLPTYPFQRQRHWIEAPPPALRGYAAGSPEGVAPAARPDVLHPTPIQQGSAAMNAVTSVDPMNRATALEGKLVNLLAEMSGEELGADAASATFLELGFDSLFIGQFAQRIEREYGVTVSFRQLLGDIPSVRDLARHLDALLPPEAHAATPLPEAIAAALPTVPQAVQPQTVASGPVQVAGIEGLFQSQLQAMQQVIAQQLQALGNSGASSPTAMPAACPPAKTPLPEKPGAEGGIGGERIKLYDPGKAGQKTTLSPVKKAFVDDLIARYAARNKASKAFTQTHRARLADPRAASGFRADLKELVFPVVCARSKGSRIWDLDGNEYIDLVNGFGQTAFGHAPDFVIEAVGRQLADGFAIGPQTPLAGEVAELIEELTGHRRVTFCNTGSEAVMAAMRVARTVTGRDRIVVFANDYHGQFDEVLVKGRSRGANPAALPIAPGIPAGSIANMVVLPYGEPSSLDWIRANAGELAAVIVEPVQSRRPDFRPVDFVREIRSVATASGFALVMDEVVTGFRVHPRGIQHVWGVRGDMATYGKVLGGGMPIGVLAGDPRFMDALDGGAWEYGDDSAPQVAPTFFAGTFVRHPVVLAAARAVLQHVKAGGDGLYERVAERTATLVSGINAHLDGYGITDKLQTYSSWFVTNFSHADPLGTLIYPHIRMNGVHVQDGYPCFLTTAHTEADFQRIEDVFKTSVDALAAAGFFSEVAGSPTAAKPPAIVSEAPLTEAQKEIWLAAQSSDEASCAFNESFSLTLDGSLDENALIEALNDVVARHDALRGRFTRRGDRFVLNPDFRLVIERDDLSDPADADARLAAIIDAEARTPFDLNNGPLVRARLVRLAPDRHRLVFTAHHIVCDGWSANLVLDDLAKAYAAKVTGSAPELKPARSFVAYATDRAGDTSSASESYWIEQFRDAPALPDLPADRPRPERRTFEGGSAGAQIGAELAKRLKAAGARKGASLFSTLLGLLQVMVARLSDARDIVIAVPSAGQSLLDGGHLVGHCVNLLPIRQSVDFDATFEAHLKRTQDAVLNAFEAQNYTYGSLVRKLGLPRDPARLPLTEIQFNLERVADKLDFPNLKARVEPNPKAFSNFDMFLNMIESKEGIRIDVDYNSAIFDRSTIERWLAGFKAMAEAVSHNPALSILDIPLMPQAEQAWLIEELNATGMAYRPSVFAHDLFAAQAAATPDAAAAEHGGRTMTYRELDQYSGRIASYLAEQVGAPGKRIGVAIDRSLDMLAVLLGVMKSGNAYVPLDTDFPEARLRQVIESADLACLVASDEATAQLAPEACAFVHLASHADRIEASPAAAPATRRPRDPSAYVIFTSGSTGAPKGVEVPHRALSNFLLSMAREPGFSARDSIVAVTTISFDIAGLELFLPLICGGKVIIADRGDVRDGFALARLIDERRPTVMQATPTLWRMLFEAGLKDLKGMRALCGGEPLPKDLAATILEAGGELWNMYGPTETTIWSSVSRILSADEPITIGKPIANTQLHILDRHGRLAPVGVTGDLHIGGDGLAKGYFKRPDLTSSAFRLQTLSGEQKRLYRTGDLGRRLPDGSLQLLGRADDQVKLRGFRIELGDIESSVLASGRLKQCAAVVATAAGGEKTLACYFVPAEGAAVDVSALSKAVADRLPQYMVPNLWIEADSLPQTANGKLDRKALAARPVTRPRKTAPPVVRAEPSSEIQRKLHEIWADVLGQDAIGIDDNIYALGADSLSVFRIAARMLDGGLNLEAKDLLRHPTIADLAAFAETREGQDRSAALAGVPSLRDFRHGNRRAAGRTL